MTDERTSSRQAGVAVHQFVPNLADGDAIGTHVRLTQRVLRGAGFRSDIFYDEAQSVMKRLGRHYTTYDREKDGDNGAAIALFQLSTGSRMTEWLLEQDVPYGVYFHNVTPPAFFERWEPNAADNLRQAEAQVKRLASRCRFAFAQSTFSKQALLDVGYAPAEVVPLLIDDEQPARKPNAKVLARLERDTTAGTRWLSVSRVAPNKCQHDIIAAFAVYRALHDKSARLTLVGGRTANMYYRSLEVLIEELGLDDAVDLTDSVPDDERDAHFRVADVYVSMSEHEGFAAPLIEAMRFHIPTVAFASSAIPETVGDATLLLDDKDPVVVAEAVHRIASDASLRASLIEAGDRRAERYSVANVGRQLVDAIRRYVPAHV